MNNAGVDDQDNDGWTPLMFAISKNCTECLVSLLKAKANTELQDARGTTALMLATSNCHLEFMKRLLAAKAKLNSIRNDGATFDCCNDQQLSRGC